MCDSREEPYLPLEGCWDLTSLPPCNFCIVSMKNPDHIEPHPHNPSTRGFGYFIVPDNDHN